MADKLRTDAPRPAWVLAEEVDELTLRAERAERERDEISESLERADKERKSLRLRLSEFEIEASP